MLKSVAMKPRYYGMERELSAIYRAMPFGEASVKIRIATFGLKSDEDTPLALRISKELSFPTDAAREMGDFVREVLGPLCQRLNEMTPTFNQESRMLLRKGDPAVAGREDRFLDLFRITMVENGMAFVPSVRAGLVYPMPVLQIANFSMLHNSVTAAAILDGLKAMEMDERCKRTIAESEAIVARTIESN